jgi:hypothetical protein
MAEGRTTELLDPQKESPLSRRSSEIVDAETVASITQAAAGVQRAWSLADKTRFAGVTLAWSALGEALGTIGFALLPPETFSNATAAPLLPHAVGLIFGAVATIVRSQQRPLTARQCINRHYILMLGLWITRDEYEERRKRCLERHDY